jgi:hypothetical protein
MRHLIAAAVLMPSAGTSLAAGPVVINGEASFPEGPAMSDSKLLHAPTGERRAVSPSPL